MKSELIGHHRDMKLSQMLTYNRAVKSDFVISLYTAL